MTLRRPLALSLAIATLMSTPTLAGTLKKAPEALDPAKAYVVVEIGKVDDGLVYGSLILSRYDMDRKEIALPAPTASSEAEFRVSLLKPAAKAGDKRLYIAELDPGLWVIEGANDTAFSLGSSTLELSPGSVTDLGVISVYSDFPEGQKRETLTSGRLMKGALLGGLFAKPVPDAMPKAIEMRPRATSDIPLPAVFEGKARTADWAGEVQFGNHLGGLVNRMGGRKALAKAAEAGQAGS